MTHSQPGLSASSLSIHAISVLPLQAGVTGQTDDRRYPGCSGDPLPTPGADPKQRWWPVQDNAYILPEYIAQVSLGQAAGNTHVLRHLKEVGVV